MIRRFLVPPTGWKGAFITLPPQEAHHLRHVLRLGEGDRIHIFDGLGHEVSARLVKGEGEILVAQVEHQVETRPPSPTHLVLGQGLPKGGKLEEILERTTELGLDHLLPVITHRSISRPDEDRGETKAQRWRKVAVAAAKQCGRADVPRVDPPVRLSDFLQLFHRDNGALGIVAWEETSGKSLRDHLPATPPSSIWILIGPEGGLTADEIHQCQNAGFITVGLGPRILRTETAGPALVAILQHVYGDMG